jgi:hypothetical protein
VFIVKNPNPPVDPLVWPIFSIFNKVEIITNFTFEDNNHDLEECPPVNNAIPVITIKVTYF